MATENLGRVALKYKGEYSSEITYKVLDVVSYEGSSYVAIKETTGNLPTNTTYWGQMAQKGAKGDAGPQGETGEKGDQGNIGQRGPQGYTYTPSVSEEGVLSWSNDGGLSNPTAVSVRGPKGETGSKGEQGQAGPKGEKGEKGEKSYIWCMK